MAAGDSSPDDVTVTWGLRSAATSLIGNGTVAKDVAHAPVEVFTMSGRFTPAMLPPGASPESFDWLTFVLDLNTGRVTALAMGDSRPDLTRLGHKVVRLGR
jgi:hypothetical protein